MESKAAKQKGQKGDCQKLESGGETSNFKTDVFQISNVLLAVPKVSLLKPCIYFSLQCQITVSSGCIAWPLLQQGVLTFLLLAVLAPLSCSLSAWHPRQ